MHSSECAAPNEILTAVPVNVKHPCGLGLPYPWPNRAYTGWTEPFIHR